MTDDVEINDRRSPYTATAGQTIFDIDFPVGELTEGDISVYINGALVESGYSFDADDSVIILDNGAAEGDSVIIEGTSEIKRKEVFPRGGNFMTSVLNAQMRRVFYILQEKDRDAGRYIQLNKSESDSVSPYLPLFSAGGILRVNNNGNGLELVQIGDIGEQFDVILTDPQTGDYLVYENGVFVNGVGGKLKVSVEDEEPNYLDSKLAEGAGIIIAKMYGGANEIILIEVDIGDEAEHIAGAAGKVASTEHLAAAIEALAPATPSWNNGGYATGKYYFGALMGSVNAALALTANRLYCVPFIVGSTETFTRIGIGVTSAHASNVRLGIYRLVNGLPAELVLDAGTVSVSTTGEKEIVISQLLNPGVYAVAALASGTPTVHGFFPINDFAMEYFLGKSGPVSSSSDAIYTAATYGALPSPFTGTPTYVSAPNAPAIWLRKV